MLLTGWEDEAAISFGEELMELLSIRSRLVVEGLDDSEANSLAETVPALAPLLRLDHPAKALVRNPFILQRLLRTRLNTNGVLSEAELAWDWWTSGAHARGLTGGDDHSRRRVLLAVTQGQLSGLSLVDVSIQAASAVSALVADEVLVQISTDWVKFQHDLFTDWAVASTLSEDPQRIQSLQLNEMPPFWVSRGFGLACQRLAESDDDSAWPNLITALNNDEVKDGWIGLALLALVHSEHSNDLLDRYSETLVDGEGPLAASLIRRVSAVYGQPAEIVLKNALPEGTTIPQGLLLPKGPYWLQLIGWCATRFERLPPEALSATIDLFGTWLTLAAFGEKTISPVLLARIIHQSA
ncbi:MAG: hypothetical protein GY761_06660 [Hyphomicrobiales bacterium]|nr:hypothetical protein [Hyphomicrobiales bacterium]